MTARRLQLINRIRALGDGGYAPSPRASMGLYKQVIREFGSWGQGVKAAGLKTAMQKRVEGAMPSPEELDQWILDNSQNGIAPRAHTSYSMQTAALRYYGNWENCVTRLGLKPPAKARPPKPPKITPLPDSKKVEEFLFVMAWAIEKGIGNQDEVVENCMQFVRKGEFEPNMIITGSEKNGKTG